MHRWLRGILRLHLWAYTTCILLLFWMLIDTVWRSNLRVTPALTKMTKREEAVDEKSIEGESGVPNSVKNKAFVVLAVMGLYLINFVLCLAAKYTKAWRTRINKNVPSPTGLLNQLLWLNLFVSGHVYLGRFVLLYFGGFVRGGDICQTIAISFTTSLFQLWCNGHFAGTNLPKSSGNDEYLSRWRKVWFLCQGLLVSILLFVVCTVNVDNTPNQNNDKGYDEDELKHVINLGRAVVAALTVVGGVIALLSIDDLGKSEDEDSKSVARGLNIVSIIWFILSWIFYAVFAASTIHLIKDQWKCKPDPKEKSLLIPLMGNVFLSTVVCQLEDGQKFYDSWGFQALNSFCELVTWSMTIITLVVFTFCNLHPRNRFANDDEAALFEDEGSHSNETDLGAPPPYAIKKNKRPCSLTTPVLSPWDEYARLQNSIRTTIGKFIPQRGSLPQIKQD